MKFKLALRKIRPIHARYEHLLLLSLWIWVFFTGNPTQSSIGIGGVVGGLGLFGVWLSFQTKAKHRILMDLKFRMSTIRQPELFFSAVAVFGWCLMGRSFLGVLVMLGMLVWYLFVLRFERGNRSF